MFEVNSVFTLFPLNVTPLRPGTRGAATARGALGWYRPSVGVPRDVGCCALVVFVAYIFSVQFNRETSRPRLERTFWVTTRQRGVLARSLGA